MPWLYILHLETPLHHCQHYTGCTGDLRQRLEAHAWGRGSNLTAVFYDSGIEWHLGRLIQVKEDITTLRGLEKLLKDQHNARAHCELCNGRRARRVPGGISIPLEGIPFPTGSRAIREARTVAGAEQEGSQATQGG